MILRSPGNVLAIKGENEEMDGKKIKVTKKHIAKVLAKGNWIIRTDFNGISYNGFKWNDIGEWTEAPDWNEETICKNGLFGQDKDHYGFRKKGNRFLFCETKGPHIPVKETKVKIRKARILLVNTLPKGIKFKGSLYLAECKLPENFTIGNVGGSLNLAGCKLPENFSIGDVGGSLDLVRCKLPENFSIGDVGGYLYLAECKLPENFTIGNVGGYLDLTGCNLPENFTIGNVGGSLDLTECKLPNGKKCSRLTFIEKYLRSKT